MHFNGYLRLVMSYFSREKNAFCKQTIPAKKRMDNQIKIIPGRINTYTWTSSLPRRRAHRGATGYNWDRLSAKTRPLQ